NLFADIGWIRDHLVMTIDHGSGASNATPQTNLVDKPGSAQTDTHQAAVPQAAAPADVAGGTSSAPADNGSGVAVTPNVLDSPATADAVTSGSQPQSEPAGQTLLDGNLMGAKAWGQHHASTGMDAALTSLLQGSGDKADLTQIAIPHAQAIENAAHQDTFVFAANFGLKDFGASGTAAHDTMQFSKSDFDGFASVLSH